MESDPLGPLEYELLDKKSGRPKGIYHAPMFCQACGQPTEVIEVRAAEGYRYIRRRRKCVGCARIGTSYERWRGDDGSISGAQRRRAFLVRVDLRGTAPKVTVLP